MHFSLFSNLLEIGATPTTFTVMIAVLACILGAEIAGIGILISKMVQARKSRTESSLEDGDHSSRNYAIGMLLFLGTVPQSTYVALSVLVTATATLAVLFVVLLVIFRACGYETVSSAGYRDEPAEVTEEKPLDVAEPAAQTNEEDAESVMQEDSYVVDEEQHQDAYTAVSDAAYEDPFAVLDEMPADEAASDDALSCEEADEEKTEMTVVTTTTEQSMDPSPAFADGTQPYKVVEKVVTETVKEIYKEAPSASNGNSNDAVMEKLVDLLDLEIRARHELELAMAKNQAAENGDVKPADAVPTFATSTDADDEDDDERDDDELEDASADGDADDRDDEENDTDGDHFTGNERIIGFDEVTGCYIVAHYRKSFEAKLIQARPNIKKYYSDLKNALLSYKGTKNRISWTADSFHNGREQIAKINVKTRILEIYFALDPASLDGTVYRGKDVGAKKKYADTPFQYKVRTPRKFKWAMELVQRVCEEHGLSPIDIEPINYEELYPFDTTENLVERKLIKEYIRQEKPASSFELDPDHVPEVPVEDETVIPANANFSWEFDNEAMVEQEPIEQAEPEIEAEVEPEEPSVPEAEAVEEVPVAAAPESPVVRETVKVTEVRYTERYYADAEPIYEQVVTTTEPIEAEAEVEEAEVEETETAEAYAEQDEVIDTDEAAEEEYTEEEYTEEEYTEEEYTEEEYTEEEYTEEEYTEEDSEEELFFAESDVEDEEPEDTLYENESAYASEESDEYESADDEEEEEVEIPASWKEKEEREALPFRPSFYANRNYYADEDAEGEETVTGDTEDEAWDEAEEDTSSVDEQYGEAYEEEVYEEAYEDSYEEQPQAEPVVARPVMASVNPAVAIIDICALEPYFEDGDMINIESLKVRELILPSATTLKLYASGEITKKFTVEANHFTLDAIQAISDADGDIVMVR